MTLTLRLSYWCVKFVPGSMGRRGGHIMAAVANDLMLTGAIDPERHPTLDNANAQLAGRLSRTEKACRRIASWTGAPAALIAAIVLQMVWITVGVLTHLDPYPFVFLLTCSNVVQLVLMFVIAVAQRQSSLHDALRAEADHGAISRLLFHQQAQELLLVRMAERLGIETDDLSPMLDLLARNQAARRA